MYLYILYYIYRYSKRKKMCLPGYYQSANGRMIIHYLGKMMHVYTLLIPMNQRVLNIYYAHLTSVGFEHCVCYESLATSFIMLFA